MNELLNLSWLDRILIHTQWRYCDLKLTNGSISKKTLYYFWSMNMFGSNDIDSECFEESEVLAIHKWIELNPLGGTYEYTGEAKRTVYKNPLTWKIAPWQARAIYAQTCRHFEPYVRDITRTWDYMENMEKLKLK